MHGGALAINNTNQLVLTNLSLIENQAQQGGAVEVLNTSNIYIFNLFFHNNSYKSDHQANEMRYGGGAIYI